ncbi:Kae1-associated kinase Bud32 [Candidatus Bathyarchaeota archaeon]|jgi:TP53 regulating kinase and related kinases|nr:Kae1-associated kinase Bud32 [Candidatus Bathyarchaeota archaeon]MBT4319191.1 Kae1-associated kinase Bud32 [Candidatus Bathyarchaeota archaeon]MBT4423708.1 Kae1-associated kinase Bud32 [Candidatus Bathyarchaeota archaeon]MBT7186020.1 Kae1-associated kinase Bud32 [Candidatus Bathyarchaeota archaeon]MBT7346650.1 Kae1-associated kinase Bud32 [Candidatus Bathyarchaeota archaeon]
MEKLVAKGAEADLYFIEWNGLTSIRKVRKPKKYRHPELDRQLTRTRTNHEADIIQRAKQFGVSTPMLYSVDNENGVIVMEYIDGIKIRDLVDQLDDGERYNLFKMIGYFSGLLHKGGIVHGDLTTSNIIKAGERIVFIDFGLSEVNFEVEKRGVDLNLMNRMLTSTHYKYQEALLAAFKEGYRESMGEEADEALERMDEVSKRGRYIDKN